MDSNQTQAAFAAGQITQQIDAPKRKKDKKKKPWWKKLLILGIVVAILWVGGHYTLSYFSSIVMQNLATLSEPIDSGVIRINDLTVQQQVQLVGTAYQLSSVAYTPSSDNTWYEALNREGYENIQRVENGLSFAYHNKKEKRASFLFSSVNATVATKKILVKDAPKVLVTIAFRGTDVKDMVDDISDMLTAVNREGVHKGFAWNADNFYKKRGKIVFDIDGKQVSLGDMMKAAKEEDSPYVFLVTGHSLGGAVADVLTGNVFVKAGLLPSNVLACTFGTPKSVSADYQYDSSNIINIINADDIVPTIGAEQQIGQNLVFHPTEEFRKTAYGDAYNVGSVLGDYNTMIGAAATGFVSHDMLTSYQAIQKDIVEHPEKYFVSMS